MATNPDNMALVDVFSQMTEKAFEEAKIGESNRYGISERHVEVEIAKVFGVMVRNATDGIMVR